MRDIRKGMLAAAVVAGLLALAGCGGDDEGAAATGSDGGGIESVPAAELGGTADADQLRALYRKAVEADQTTITIAGAAVPNEKKLFEAFSRDFPEIEIKPVAASSPQLVTMVNAESASGKHSTDLAETTIVLLLGFDREKKLVRDAVFTGKGIDDRYIGPNKGYYAVSLTPFGLTWNTKEVKDAELPKTWNELLDPKWKGKIGMAAPTVIGPITQVFTAMLNSGNYTPDFIQRLRDQAPKLAAPTNPAGTGEAVAQGVVSLGIPASQKFTVAARDKGAPVDFRLWAEDNFVSQNSMALLKNAPNELAAKLYMNWLLTPRGGAAVAKNVSGYSPVPGSPPPPGLPPLDDVDVMDPVPATQQLEKENEAVAIAKGIFGS